MSDNRPKETLLDNPRYKLSARVSKGGENGNAKFSFQYAFNKLQVSMWPGFKGDKGLHMEIAPSTLFMFLHEITEAATSESFKDVRFNLQNYKREKVGELIVARSDEGVIWVSAVADGFPKIKFELLYPDNVEVTALNGESLSKAKLSRLRAIGYAKSLMAVIGLVMQEGYDPNSGAKFNKSRRGSGSSEGSGSDGNNFESDIPDGW